MEEMNQHYLVKQMFQPALPVRKKESHKGTNGSIAIIGGADGMVGAVFLASRAALFCGAGRVYSALLSQSGPTFDIVQPEIMLRTPLGLNELSQLDCVVIGPGLGQSNDAVELLEFWLEKRIPLILDADALNLIAKYPQLANVIKNRLAETIMTPHVGEASRLLNATIDSIQNDRAYSAVELAKSLGVICVLKGAGSICANSDGNWFINSTGNPGLSSAGTGDVLSGIIGSFVAQGISGFEAAKLGVHLHGAAADALVERGLGPVGLTASELAHEVRSLINEYNLGYQD